MAEEDFEKAFARHIEVMTQVDIARHLRDVLYAIRDNPEMVHEELTQAETEFQRASIRGHDAKDVLSQARWARYNAEYALHMQQACALLIPPGGDLQHQAEPGSDLEAFLNWLRQRRPGTCSRLALTTCCFAGNAGFVGAAVGGACQPCFGLAFYLYVVGACTICCSLCHWGFGPSQLLARCANCLISVSGKSSSTAASRVPRRRVEIHGIEF